VNLVKFILPEQTSLKLALLCRLHLERCFYFNPDKLVSAHFWSRLGIWYAEFQISLQTPFEHRQDNFLLEYRHI